MRKLRQTASLLLCFALMSAITIINNGKWFGMDTGADSRQPAVAANDTMYQLKDGSDVINTTYLARDVMGYGGNVPLEVTIQDNTITGIKALPNSETPDFFSAAAVLMEQYKGKSVDDAIVMQVDAVTGATYSSKAITANMKRALEYYQRAERVEDTSLTYYDDPKTIAAALVILLAAIVPLFTKNRKVRAVQQVLNVCVLGLWCGTFISYSSIISFLANGTVSHSMLTAVLCIIVCFLYPLFGKPSYYCTNVCPFGSLQALVGKPNRHKLRIPAHAVKRLDLFRKVLWVALNACLLTGVFTSWMDYEPFTAFLFRSASVVSLAIAGVFTVLSYFVARPYCRFVCPTGTLLKYCQKG